MTRIRIDQQNLETGMIIAKDIFTLDGILIVPSETELTAKLISKINVHKVDDIIIQIDSSKEEGKKAQINYKPTNETAAFLEFSFKYDQQVTQVQEHLSHIVQTGMINPNNLSSLVSDIITTTATRSQLFTYMCRLHSSDDVTYSHSINVSLYASILGRWLNLNDLEIKDLALAGLLHDIGKIKVDQVILNKKETLSAAEFNLLKEHTTFGYEIVLESDLPIGIKQAILLHHEKMNGRGYPLGLSWDHIHDYAKIVSIVDIYDAMTSDRPYHKRFHPFQVIEMFEKECYGILDTKYLYVFLEHIAQNFLGDTIALNNGDIGEIIFINKQFPSKPLIQLSQGTIIDLSTNPSLTIQSFL